MKHLIFALSLLILFVTCDDTTPSPTLPNVFNISYGNHPLQTFKLETPEGADENTKVVLLVHGGAWVLGYHPDETVTTFTGRFGWNLEEPLLNEGFAVATMKYRTACYNVQPNDFGNNTMFHINQMMEDIDLVINNLQSNASDYNINPNHIQLVGESAGGHLALYYGVGIQVPDGVQSVVSMFAPTDLDATDFKNSINGFPLYPVISPDYILRKPDNCNSVSNQQVRFWFCLKSLSDHDNLEVNQENNFLDSLSSTSDYRIDRDMPLFLTHGNADDFVPHTQADAMLTAMENAFGPISCNETDFSCQLKLRKYNDCAHGWSGQNCDRNTIMDDVVKWLKEH